MTLFLYAAIGIFFFLFPLNLIQVQGYSATATGAAILPLILLMFSLSRWSGGLVARYGSRGPLNLWSSYCGRGFRPVRCALDRRRLLEGILSSDDRSRLWDGGYRGSADDRGDEFSKSGFASAPPAGVNNAVARVAGVLAIAVLGIIMVGAFASRLNHSHAQISLPPGVQQGLQAEEIKLADLQVPDALSPGAKAAVKAAIGDAFVFGFRMVLLICVLLSLASAAVAWLMIPPDGDRHRPADSGA